MKSRRLKVVVLISVVSISIFVWLKSEQFIKTKGYDSLPSFVNSCLINYSESSSAEINISIEIAPHDFQKLQNVRDSALKRGVIIQPKEPYVPCVITFGAKQIEAKIRLKGKMTDHVTGKKWSFRIKSKKNTAFMGMQRFTLQHPGTRGYTFEWLHHQMCKREQIMALRYDYANLTLNGIDLGIYAIEENFSQSLVQNNKKPKGPLFRFNPTLYWQSRLNIANKTYVAQEYTNFQNAHIEVFSKKEIFTDTTLKKQFVEANNIMNQVRWGKMSLSDAFDIKKLAMRYALLDLCGGYHSVDWSDVKFYYNPILQKIEPVAYESFGPRHINQIIGDYRFTESKDKFPSDFHKIIFRDTVFFENYIKALIKISSNDYLDNTIRDLAEELNKQKSIQYSEFPYKDFNLNIFENNLKTIRKSLNAPKAFHAYLKNRKGNNLTLQIQVIESLPYEILGIRVNTKKFLTPFKKVFPALTKSHKPIFDNIKIRIDSTIALDTKRTKNLFVYYRLLGDTTVRECEVFPYSINTYTELPKEILSPTLFSNKTDFITIDSVSKRYIINVEKVSIAQSYLIPKDWTLTALYPLRISFEESGNIKVLGKIELLGSKESPIQIRLNTKSENWLKAVEYEAEIVIKSAVIYNELPSSILCYGSSINVNHAQFSGNLNNAIKVYHANLNVSNSSFKDAQKSALDLSFSTSNVQNSVFVMGNKGIDSKWGQLLISNSFFRHLKIGIETKQNDKVTVMKTNMTNNKIGVIVKDASDFSWSSGELFSSNIGIDVHQRGNLYNPAKAEFSNVSFKNNKQKFILEKGNTLKIDDAFMTPNKK